MAVNTPKINRIYRMTEFDQLRTAIKEGNMYICTDSLQMYYDESNVKRSKYVYTGIKTINDLMYNTSPSYGVSYYCWEDNSLWLWLNKWITLYADTNYPSAYIYTTYPTKEEPGQLNSVFNINNVLDNNGLLQDGSVVIRDGHRIIKGKLFVNEENDNLTFSSFLGGGIRLLPNGEIDTNGELFIGDEGESFLRSSLLIKNNEEYIDYSEHPELDKNPYKNDTHKYKVYHEGNLDTSAILEMTPQQIYQKLQDKSLPDSLDLSVSMISGKTIDDISLVGHKHIANDITNFNEQARNQASIEIRNVLTGIQGEGITITPLGNDDYRFSANDFTLTFTGGVVGSSTVSHLTNTTLNLSVDPTKHIHQNYIDRMDDIQVQINNINAMDKNDYYTKSETDNLIDDLQGTVTPVSGKPLLVNEDGILPGIVTSANKLTSNKTITFTGDITGTLTTDFSANSIVELNASNIVSVVPETGKALLVDSNGNLPGNSETASALNHPIQLNLTNEVLGSGQLDTTKNSMSISATLNPGDNILQTKDLGVTVANLDEDGLIPENLIPLGAGGGLIPQGTFVPSSGYPSDNPHNGDFWIASTSGTLNGEQYNAGDWCLYIDNEWQHISQSNTVISVNGKQGTVVLTADDINAISDTYINYNVGQTIPSGYIVRTSDDGIITGASVDKLTNEFEVTTDSNSDIEVATNSTNPSTDGSTDLGLNLQITQTGLNKIQDEVGFTVQNSGVNLNHRPYINFNSGFNITTDESTITINTQNKYSNCIFIDLNNTNYNSTQFLNTLTELYNSRVENPFIIYVRGTVTANRIAGFCIDSNSVNLQESNTFTITSNVNFCDLKHLTNGYTQLGSTNYKLKITTNTDVNISKLELTSDITVLGTVLSTTNNTGGNITTFIPTMDWQPATKKYVDDAVSYSQALGYTTNIGDGTNTSYTINHGLENENVIVQCRLVNTGEQVWVNNTIVDKNHVTIQFAKAPASNSVQVIVK